ncbi:hypothetical protein BD289DRAFT_486340 [Coniella lustricola]|uniref:RRM domain-containing protein n=1 Tax=Coniella lustricola TaxID=2025994 RepID=A0A2T2ZVE3_9PEZI|nr:hypothetical protein BD289DRAFT_486340 [Coniella lustricola]
MPFSKNYDTSPERPRFQRPTGVKHSSSERAASPSSSEASSGADEPGGVRLAQSTVSDSPELSWTPGRSRRASVIEQDSPSYVVATADEDDVFISPGRGLNERERLTHRTLTILNSQSSDGNERGVRQQAENPQAQPTTERHQINGVDAQNLYPPTACVFVANLPEPKEDTALEAAIYREFLQYGKCWVKIRRDTTHMPFAFVQYTNDAEAHAALAHAKGALILGRPCRTEPVKANRTYVIQKKDGGPISLEEAREALLTFGPLSKCEHLHDQLRKPLGYPPTVLVEFAMFDANRDLQSVFRLDPHYHVTAFDLKRTCAVNRLSNDEAFLAACERDRRSIFVGDLAHDATDELLRELFSQAGEILNVNIFQRAFPVNHSTTSSIVRTMAFVEYTQPNMPEDAIAKFHGAHFMGNTIRVERKVVKDRGSTPRHQRSHASLGHKASQESVGRNYVLSTPHGGRSSSGLYSTPRHISVNRGPMDLSPASMPPPPYNNWGFTHGGPPGSAGGAGGGPPVTPQGPPPQMMPLVSPWSYYNSNWPGYMAPGDPSLYMSPFFMQTHGPHMGGSTTPGGEGFNITRSADRYSPRRSAGPAGHRGGGFPETPTRGSSHVRHGEQD